MEVEAGAAACFKRNVVLEAGLLGEGLEQRGDAADALVIQIGHGLGAIETDGGAGPEQERVTDEQHAPARGERRSGHGQDDGGD